MSWELLKVVVIEILMLGTESKLATGNQSLFKEDFFWFICPPTKIEVTVKGWIEIAI